jgi:hypothetical protein
MNILENIKPCGEIPLQQKNIDYFKKSTNSSFTNSLKFLEDVNKFKPYQLFEVF